MTFQDDNGNTLEFEGSFAITKQATSFFDSEIKGDVSLNFNIENNSVNRKTLNYFGTQMIGQVAWVKQPFNRMKDGNVIDRGYIIIQSEETDVLNCFYVSGNSNWMQLLQGLITELDYSGVLSTKNYEVQMSSDTGWFSNIGVTSGVCFPFVDWIYGLNKGAQYYYMCPSETINGKTIPIDSSNDFINNPVIDFYPCFYLHTLVEEIMAQKNFKIGGNLINDKLYKSLVVTPHNGLIRRKDYATVTATGSTGNIPIGFSRYKVFTETSDADGYFYQSISASIASLSSWTNVGSGLNWTTGSSPTITIAPSFNTSKFLATPLVIDPRYVYNFSVTLTDTNSNFVRFVTLNASNVQQEIIQEVTGGGVLNITFYPTLAATQIAFVAQSIDIGSTTVTITVATLNTVNLAAYVTDKNAILIFTTTLVARNSTDIDYIAIYRNGVSVWDSAVLSGNIGWVTGSTVTAQLVGRKNDYFEWFIHNSGAVTRQASINIQVDVAKIIVTGDFVTPDLFLPPLSCVDFLKFIFNYFGCSVYFNEYSKTLSANIIENISLETSPDWSDYYLSHRSEYTVKQAAHNYLRLNKSNDNYIINYDAIHTVGFGEGDIPTSNTLQNSIDLITFPISSAKAGVSKNGYYLSNVPLAQLENDGDPIAFTAITDLGSGVCKFTVADSSVFKNRETVLLVNAAGTILGNIVIQITDATNISAFFKFYGTDSGRIFKQAIKYNEIGAKILSVLPNTSVTNQITSRQDGLAGHIFNVYLSSSSTLDYATFVKEKLGLGIDSWPANCALDNPTVNSSTFTDPTIKQLYLNKISRFFQNANIRCQMLLPESVYQSFDFSNFIYLKTEKLTGYFFVDSIVNYQDANTPVEVNLYMM